MDFFFILKASWNDDTISAHLEDKNKIPQPFSSSSKPASGDCYFLCEWLLVLFFHTAAFEVTHDGAEQWFKGVKNIIIGEQSPTTKGKKSKSNRRKEECLQYLACKVCVYIYIVNSIIIFSTFCTKREKKKEDLVCSVGCGKSVKSSLRGAPSRFTVYKNSLIHDSVRSRVFDLLCVNEASWAGDAQVTQDEAESAVYAWCRLQYWAWGMETRVRLISVTCVPTCPIKLTFCPS